jgi:hypothetical protein
VKELSEMATQIRNVETVETTANRIPTRLMQIDGLAEITLGAFLLLMSGTVAHWLSLSATAVMIGGVGTAAFGIWLLYMAQQNLNRRTMRFVALLNLAWVAVSAVVLVADWNTFTNEGRWLVTLVADAALILGLAELFVRRDMP